MPRPRSLSVALLLVSTFAMIVDSGNLVLFAITMFLAVHRMGRHRAVGSAVSAR
jgi:hypothetical protein